jgi:hypothetical protein
MLKKDAQTIYIPFEEKWAQNVSFDEVYDKFALESFTSQTT